MITIRVFCPECAIYLARVRRMKMHELIVKLASFCNNARPNEKMYDEFCVILIGHWSKGGWEVHQLAMDIFQITQFMLIQNLRCFEKGTFYHEQLLGLCAGCYNDGIHLTSPFKYIAGSHSHSHSSLFIRFVLHRTVCTCKSNVGIQQPFSAFITISFPVVPVSCLMKQHHALRPVNFFLMAGWIRVSFLVDWWSWFASR